MPGPGEPGECGDGVQEWRIWLDDGGEEEGAYTGLGMGTVLRDELGRGEAFLRTRQKGGQGLTEASFGTREIMQKYAKDHANEPGWWLVGRGPSW